MKGRANQLLAISGHREETMPKSSRKVVDCRLYPSVNNCTLTLSGSEEEVLSVAVRHAVEEHEHKDTPELREQIRAILKDE